MFTVDDLPKIAEIINASDSPADTAAFYAFGYMINLVPLCEELPADNVRQTCKPVLDALRNNGAKFIGILAHAKLRKRFEFENKHGLLCSLRRI